MAHYNYSIKAGGEQRSKAVLLDAPMSYKVAVMIARRIKGMPAEKALRFLSDVQAKKQAVPYTKFNDGVGHRPGMAAGRYPFKAAKLYEQLVSSAVANSEDKGLGKDVWIEFVVAQQGSRTWHYGRQGRRRFKRAHVELIVSAAENPKAKKVTRREPVKKAVKPSEKKAAENEVAEKKVENKAEKKLEKKAEKTEQKDKEQPTGTQ